MLEIWSPVRGMLTGGMTFKRARLLEAVGSVKVLSSEGIDVVFMVLWFLREVPWSGYSPVADFWLH